MSEWFEAWFGEEYLELYPHRDDREAEQVTRLLVSRGVLTNGSRVLDLACGSGRHARALAAAGARVVGLDLSKTMLRAARRTWPDWRLVRGDVRVLPFRTGAFDAVVNLFTSFGYFADEREDRTVLGEVARVLRQGGRFALDFLNAPQVRASLVPRDERRLGRRTVVQERRVQDGFVVKTIRIEGDRREFIERVRLYERADLERLAGSHGLVAESVLGDYDGAPHDDESPRLLLLFARR